MKMCERVFFLEMTHHRATWLDQDVHQTSRQLPYRQANGLERGSTFWFCNKDNLTFTLRCKNPELSLCFDNTYLFLSKILQKKKKKKVNVPLSAFSSTFQNADLSELVSSLFLLHHSFPSFSPSSCVSFSSCFEMHTLWLTNSESQCGMINQPNSATLPRTHRSFQTSISPPFLAGVSVFTLVFHTHTYTNRLLTLGGVHPFLKSLQTPIATFLFLSRFFPHVHVSCLECVHGDT